MICLTPSVYVDLRLFGSTEVLVSSAKLFSSTVGVRQLGPLFFLRMMMLLWLPTPVHTFRHANQEAGVSFLLKAAEAYVRTVQAPPELAHAPKVGQDFDEGRGCPAVGPLSWAGRTAVSEKNMMRSTT